MHADRFFLRFWRFFAVIPISLPTDNTSDATCAAQSLDSTSRSAWRSGSRFAMYRGDGAATIAVDRVIQSARCAVVVAKIPRLPSEEN